MLAFGLQNHPGERSLDANFSDREVGAPHRGRRDSNPTEGQVAGAVCGRASDLDRMAESLCQEGGEHPPRALLVTDDEEDRQRSGYPGKDQEAGNPEESEASAPADAIGHAPMLPDDAGSAVRDEWAQAERVA